MNYNKNIRKNKLILYNLKVGKKLCNTNNNDQLKNFKFQEQKLKTYSATKRDILSG